jgi:hypothetical protein
MKKIATKTQRALSSKLLAAGFSLLADLQTKSQLPVASDQ